MDTTILWTMIAHRVDYHPYKAKTRNTAWVRTTAPLTIPYASETEAPPCARIVPALIPVGPEAAHKLDLRYKSPFEITATEGGYFRSLINPASSAGDLELDREAFETLVRTWRTQRNRSAFPHFPLRFYGNGMEGDLCLKSSRWSGASINPFELGLATELETIHPVHPIDEQLALTSAQRHAAEKFLAVGPKLLRPTPEPLWGVACDRSGATEVLMLARGRSDDLSGHSNWHFFRADRFDDALAFARQITDETQRLKVEGSADIHLPGAFHRSDLLTAIKDAGRLADRRRLIGSDDSTRTIRAMCDAIDILAEFEARDETDQIRLASDFCDTCDVLAEGLPRHLAKPLQQHIARIRDFELALRPSNDEDLKALAL